MDERRHAQDGDDRGRDASADFGPEDEDGQGQDGKTDGRRAGRVHAVQVDLPLVEEVGRQRARLQAQQVLDLLREYDHRDAGGEAHRQRVRDEFDDGPQAQGAHSDEHDSGHQRAEGQAVDP